MKEAKRLRRLRENLKVSQRDLAKEFKVGHGAVSFWESGRRTIPGPILKLMEIYERELGFENPDEEEPFHLERIDSSWISRNFVLSSVMARILARIAGNSLQRLVGAPSEPFSDTIAQKLGDAFGDLKGLMTKVGQMMSYTDFGLSERARLRLSILQDRSTAFKTEVIESVFEKDFAQKPASLFSAWSPEPIGVGSIGQVHRAITSDGSQLAVKIQYPGIEHSIDSDLKNTQFARVLSPFLFRKQNEAELLSEFKDRFTEECNYVIEGEWQNAFLTAFSRDAKVVIPKVYPQWSSRRVLTSELLDGKRFSEFMQGSSETERNLASQTIFRIAFTSAFHHGMLNCDPNPGNYLFMSDGRIGLIDFGCVKKLQPQFVRMWKDYLLCFIRDDLKKANHLMVEMGYVQNPRAFDFEYHNTLMKLIHKPWLQTGTFRFDREYVISIWKMIAVDSPNLLKITLPRDWLFVNRLQWGLYSVLATLEGEASFREIMLPLLEK